MEPTHLVRHTTDRLWARELKCLLMVLALLVAETGNSVGNDGVEKDKCRSPELPWPEKQRKFNPGHYVTLDAGRVSEQLAALEGMDISGIQVRYRWQSLETERDVYDFSMISRDLEVVAERGLQLVAVIVDKSFDGQPPTPRYLHDQFTIRHQDGGFIALRWDPFVMDRLKQLVKLVGMNFDCHPNFEGIAFQESSLSADERVLALKKYTPEKYRDALGDLLVSASNSLPRSRIFWYMNYLTGKQQYIAEIAEAVIGRGVVMGGPDILPDNRPLARLVYPFYSQFRGRLPLFNSMQPNSYRHLRAEAGRDQRYWTLEELFIFARDRLYLDYIFWEYRPWPKPRDSYSWRDAQLVIERYPEFSTYQRAEQ